MSFFGYPWRGMSLRRLAIVLLLACDPPAPAATPAPELPDSELCAPAAAWPEPWADAEVELLRELNALRAEGGRCGDLVFAPAPPLRMHPDLRCVARLHTADMIARDYVAAVDPDGLGTGARLALAGYDAATFTEAVAVVHEDEIDEVDDALDVLTAWRTSPTNCWQLHARELSEVGVGAREGVRVPKDETDPRRAGYWTLTLAAPP